MPALLSSYAVCVCMLRILCRTLAIFKMLIIITCIDYQVHAYILINAQSRWPLLCCDAIKLQEYFWTIHVTWRVRVIMWDQGIMSQLPKTYCTWCFARLISIQHGLLRLGSPVSLSGLTSIKRSVMISIPMHSASWRKASFNARTPTIPDVYSSSYCRRSYLFRSSSFCWKTEYRICASQCFWFLRSLPNHYWVFVSIDRLIAPIPQWHSVSESLRFIPS